MRISMLSAAVAATLFTTGCFGACSEMAAEAITEKALGVQDIDVDAEKGTITIKGKDGELIHAAGDGEDSTVTIKGKDGEVMEYNAGNGGKLPKGFPFAVADGSKVQGSASSSTGTEQTFMVSLAGDGAVDELAAFYVKELESKGLKVERTDVNVDGKQFVTLGGKVEGREVSVAISSADEGGGTFTQFSVRDSK
jgi:major membrane immunogen (membrane-anchored lipoprotein)